MKWTQTFERTAPMKTLFISVVAAALDLVAGLPTHAAVAQTQPASSIVQSLDGEWRLATDPKNEGRDQQWFKSPRPEAVPAKVPWIIQDAFPGYHGVAWYWRDFVAPSPLGRDGRLLLRFRAVDYQAEVWVNGRPVGGHEGGETPFVLDVTDAIKSHSTNLLAVRVLNPTSEPIDSIVLNQTPHRNKATNFFAGASYNHGGIMNSVELLAVPAVRVEDLSARPDAKTGVIRLQAIVRNATAKSLRGQLTFTVAPAASGETLDAVPVERDLPSGDTVIEASLRVAQPRLWELNDPYLYRVTARVGVKKSTAFDEQSVRCGFRDFRFADGYFRLNGRRIFLRGSHTGNHFPIGFQLPHDPDLLRRDLLNVKVMGFNLIRFIAGMATRDQLDLCDEIGLLVYEESYAAWLLEDSPKMAERFDRSTTEMIRRDRNHPSLVLWGLLNETSDGPVFRHAVASLPLVRALDDSRAILLSSGRWDGQLAIGSVCNPGSMAWEHLLGDEQPGASPSRMSSPGGYCKRMGDVHGYPRVPHTAQTIQFLRTLGQGTKPVLLSEYGIGSAVDLWRVVRHYESLGKESAEDAQFYRAKLNDFLADWERWRLSECFGRPEDYFAQCIRKMAGQRLLGLNAIRANPNLVGYNLTGTVDQGMTGEGLFTTWRELKPGTTDALFDGLAPLRWCLFAEPLNLYRGNPVKLEAVLANEDALLPGTYPVRLQVFDPNNQLVWSGQTNVVIQDRKTKIEPPLALPVFADDVVINGPAGKYRFVAALERGGAPAGGEAEFYVADPATLPRVDAEIVLWGSGAELSHWLETHGIRSRAFSSVAPTAREVILTVKEPQGAGDSAEWSELAHRVARGATAVFLSPEVFRKGHDKSGWLPLANKGSLNTIQGWLYLKDEWARRHAIFEGLPAGGLMDYTFYRELIPDAVWSGQGPPDEAVAGAIRTSQDYSAGLMMAVYKLGAGRFILNTLRIRENLGSHPAADRLLNNLLRFAARDANQPLADLPADFEAQLKSIGYK